MNSNIIMSNADTGGTAAFIAKRLALKLDPCCFYLEYQDAASKTRIRAVSICCVDELPQAPAASVFL
jgi:hypothetical protein